MSGTVSGSTGVTITGTGGGSADKSGVDVGGSVTAAAGSVNIAGNGADSGLTGYGVKVGGTVSGSSGVTITGTGGGDWCAGFIRH